MIRLMAVLLAGWMVGVSAFVVPARAGDEAAQGAHSAALGEAKALYALQRFDRARQAFAALARAGHAEAAFRLALMLETGEGGPANPERALHWLHMAARAGYEPACQELAARRGIAGKALSCGKEDADGDLLLHEAEAGDVKAMLLLARAKAAAQDGKLDLEGAVAWLTRAAARGDVRVKTYVAEALARICAQPAAPVGCRKVAAGPAQVTPPVAVAADAGK